MKLNFRGMWIRSTLGALLLACAVILTACGGGGGGGSEGPKAPSAFTLIAPTDAATGIIFTPTLSWTDSSGESSYTLQISTYETFTPLTYETTTIPANTTSFTIPEANKLTVNTPYYWRVIAVNSVGQTVASNASLTFTTLKSGELAWSQTSNPSSFPDVAYGIALNSNALYITGYDSYTTKADDQWRVEKRNLSDGSLVTSFSSDGVVTENPSNLDFWSFDDAYAIAIDSVNNYMYVVGYDSVSRGTDTNSTDEEWRIEKRRLSDGGLDISFGTNGIVTSDTSTYDPYASVDTGMDEAHAIAIDSSSMYVVGYETSTLGDKEWRIEKRSLSNGSLDSSFGTGEAVVEPSSMDNAPTAIVVDSANNWMYVVGYDTTAGRGQEWRIEKRLLSTGESVTTFGSNGVEFSDPSAGEDEANAIAVDSTSMYVAGYSSDATGSKLEWRIEKRSLADGSLDISFGPGNDGIVISSLTGTVDAVPNAIAIDSTYMYVAGYDTVNGSLEWRIEKRSLTDGSLDTNFGIGGVMTVDFDLTRPDDIWSIAVDSDYIYTVGYDSSPGDYSIYFNKQWRIEKRAK